MLHAQFIIEISDELVSFALERVDRGNAAEVEMPSLSTGLCLRFDLVDDHVQLTYVLDQHGNLGRFLVLSQTLIHKSGYRIRIGGIMQ